MSADSHMNVILEVIRNPSVGLVVSGSLIFAGCLWHNTEKENRQSMKDEIGYLKQEMSILKENVKTLYNAKAEVLVMREKVANVSSRNDELKSLVDILQSNDTIRNIEINRLKNENESLKDEIGRLKKENEELKTNIAITKLVMEERGYFASSQAIP